MKNKLSIISYTLATMAGICFISGLAILSSEEEHDEPTRSSTPYVGPIIKH